MRHFKKHKSRVFFKSGKKRKIRIPEHWLQCIDYASVEPSFHEGQCGILKVFWRDKVRNESITELAASQHSFL